MEKMICGKCKKEIDGPAVLAPTIVENERVRCPKCAWEDMREQSPEIMTKFDKFIKELDGPKTKCKKIMVPEDVCYVAFFNEREKWQTYQEELGVTPRNEMIIADFNEKHEIIGIELIGDKKPCQAFTHLLKSVKDGKG